MAKAWICDRCGRYTKDGIHSIRFGKTIFFDRLGWDSEKGLCNKCYSEFRRFLGGEELHCSTEKEE